MNETSYFQITSYDFFPHSKKGMRVIYETLGTHPPISRFLFPHLAGHEIGGDHLLIGPILGD